MAYILVGDAGWASMQADCHRFMRFLIEINNGFAQNPNYDFHAFRAAVDGIVRDEIGRRTAQPVMCTLRILVFDVLRPVWMCIHPSCPYDWMRPVEVAMAPFFVIDNLLPDLDGRVGINALHRYVKDNLQGEYELEELLDGPLVPRTPLRLPLTHDNIIRHQAELGETVR